ncbi:1-acyl-sn-glycerol-3-phosphate acyltransferase [candidate division WOR-3 bacterium]|nr:1-acyl-sn-glycerol-3-phosphate acyltransferase [candidate division WOR-3 bacterium]
MFAERISYLWRDILWWLLKIFIGLPLRLLLRVRMEGEVYSLPKGRPGLFLGNHTNTLDPFIVAFFIKRPVCFVVTDDDFRFAITRTLLGWLKFIPTAKNTPDFTTIHMLIKAFKEGQIVGLSPGGGRNWDGLTPSVDATITRLIKKFHLPVICARVRGAYLTWPRWSNLPRLGRIIVRYSCLFKEPADIPESEEKIALMINNELSHCEFADPEITKRTFFGLNIAQGLELRFWFCPLCGDFFALKSEGRHLSCSRCSARWKFLGDGRFVLIRPGNAISPEARNFTQYLDWAHHNDSETLRMIMDRKKLGRNPLLTVPARMSMSVIEKRNERRFKKPETGTAALTHDFRMVFTRTADAKCLLDIPLHKMKGPNVVWNNRFEFFLPGMAYRLDFYGQSAYFWHFVTKETKKILKTEHFLNQES